MPVLFHLDTGACRNVLDYNTFELIQRKSGAIPLSPTNIKLKAYDQTELTELEKFSQSLERRKNIILEGFFVVQGENGNLLSGDASLRLGLIKVMTGKTEKHEKNATRPLSKASAKRSANKSSHGAKVLSGKILETAALRSNQVSSQEHTHTHTHTLLCTRDFSGRTTSRTRTIEVSSKRT